jgi:DNA-directed RNA polymerase subunit N (RpoN/RPB10)
MKTELVHTLTDTFEAHAQQAESGVEFWLGRDLQHLLGYAKWDNFLNVVSKAKTACEVSGHEVADHFADVGKMVDLGSGSQREVDDLRLTRYACYLIAQNGDPKKPEITIFNTHQHQLASESAISTEHVTNNQAVRKTLMERGIRPERLPAAEDVKKVERRVAEDEKKALKDPDALDT